MMPEKDLERCINAVLPELKVALRSIVNNGKASDAFTLLEWTQNSHGGVKSKIVCIVAVDTLAAVLEGTLQGVQQSNELYAAQVARMKGLAS